MIRRHGLRGEEGLGLGEGLEAGLGGPSGWRLHGARDLKWTRRGRVVVFCPLWSRYKGRPGYLGWNYKENIYNNRNL